METIVVECSNLLIWKYEALSNVVTSFDKSEITRNKDLTDVYVGKHAIDILKEREKFLSDRITDRKIHLKILFSTDRGDRLNFTQA